MKKTMVLLLLSVLVGAFAFANDAADLSTAILGEYLSGMSSDMMVGSPIELPGKTLVPLFEGEGGFFNVSGGPEGVVYGTGVGGGLNVIPFAVIVVSEQGVEVVPVSNRVSALGQLMEALPQIIPMVMQFFMLEQSSAAPMVQEPARQVQVRVEPQPVEREVVQTLKPDPLEHRINELYDTVPMQGMAKDKQILGEVKALSQQFPEDSRLHALSGYMQMMQIEDANPLAQMKMAVEAQKEIDRALQLNPDDRLALESNGWMNLYNPMGNLAKSAECFEKVLSMEPDNAEIMEGLVQAYQKMGKMDQAKEIARRGLELQPGNEVFKGILQ
ncbi:MAG TPA: spore germination protein GerW family protein [Thermotogota bacterium]|nr:spore germination protein GerW family protein [Thermotogota bacterium]HRW92200.1 spore germination protein GerW family protein [Thermotogota bacterium]